MTLSAAFPDTITVRVPEEGVGRAVYLVGGCGKIKTEKSSLIVYVGGEIVFRTGSEERPFKELMVTDWEGVAERIVEGIRD